MIGSGGLKDHALNGIAGKPCDQCAVTSGIIGEVAGRPVGAETDIEPIFGNVDAASLWQRMIHLFRVLSLPCGPSRPGIRSGYEEKRGAV